MLAPAGFAQQQNDTTGTSSGESQQSTSSSKAKSSSSSMSDAHIKPGTDYSHWELFMGYTFVGYEPGLKPPTPNASGGSASLAYNFNRWAGLVADFGGYHTGSEYGTYRDINNFTFLGGPRFSYRSNSRLTPYAQMLFGDVTCRGDSPCIESARYGNAFGITAGLGLDLALTKRVSWRMVQTEYFLSHFDNPGGSNPQNNIRVSSGLVFRWGAHPEMVNRPPTATLTADKNSVVQGSPENVGLHCIASDPDGDSLTYSYTATGGRVDGTGPDARWNAGGAGPGNNTITCQVDDGHGGTASASVGIGVTAPPPAPKPPTMSCSVDRGTVMAGERVSVTATASSPQNYNLNYTWRANAGQVVGTGSSVQFDTTGLSPGSYTITGRADDAHGQAADCTVDVAVQQPPPPPQASKINECAFKPAISARVDNVCKRVLDDVALRLQNEPKGTLVIVGYADPKNKRAEKLGTDRAQNAAAYLAGKGIDKSRITVRSGSGQEGAGAANHRIDIVWVPEGATY
jgi:outer membrane protein OmpA-like peptidoglycan-associated protein